jgi:hypothetical protein
MGGMDRNKREGQEKGKAKESLIPKHGGYRKLKSFQIAQLVYDMTVRFCDRYIDKKSRTHDQMVQAARSGVQNIAEGSVEIGYFKTPRTNIRALRASSSRSRLALRSRKTLMSRPTSPPGIRKGSMTTYPW